MIKSLKLTFISLLIIRKFRFLEEFEIFLYVVIPFWISETTNKKLEYAKYNNDNLYFDPLVTLGFELTLGLMVSFENIYMGRRSI